jgi:hypothetical protein
MYAVDLESASSQLQVLLDEHRNQKGLKYAVWNDRSLIPELVDKLQTWIYNIELSDNTSSSNLISTLHVKFWKPKSPWTSIQTALNKDYFIEMCTDERGSYSPKAIHVYHYGDVDKCSVKEQDLMPVIQLPFEDKYILVSLANFPSGP